MSTVGHRERFDHGQRNRFGSTGAAAAAEVADDRVARAGEARGANNIGVLRLLFASLVIIGHAFEQIDGNRLREPLARWAHGVSLGEISVDAFFVLSGFLVAQSAVRSPSLGAYFLKRIARIYPAFVVAFVLSVFALGPLVGAKPLLELPHIGWRLLTLQSPPIQPTQFVGLPYPDLNGSIWSIAYEFRCYLLIGLLSLSGVLRRPVLVSTLLCLGLAVTFLQTFPAVHAWLERLSEVKAVAGSLGDLGVSIRLTTLFLAGTVFYLYREWLLPRLTPGAVVICLLITALLMLRAPHFIDVGLAIFGPAVLFGLAFKAKLGPAQRLNDRWDISYGAYLYGWPVATTILWFNRGIDPWTLGLSTLVIAFALGAASWWGLEGRVAVAVASLEQRRTRRAAAP